MSSNKRLSGDDGSTGILGPERLPKYHPRIEALGALDEASAALGLARSQVENARVAAILKDAQRDLYVLMSEVATPPDKADRLPSLGTVRLDWLDQQIKQLEEIVPIPKKFILPGESVAGASLALARTIVRRAERRVTELVHRGEVKNEIIIPYLNRLSSLCFMLELSVTHAAGQAPSLAKE